MYADGHEIAERSLEVPPIQIKRNREEGMKILHFSLRGLLSTGLTLALNLETRTLSLLSDGPQLVSEDHFSVNEMSLIVPILKSYPYYCPYEVLLAHISSKHVDPSLIERCRHRLLEAQINGTWQQEMRPVRRALSSLRSKLHSFDLEVSTVRERGCNLTSLTFPAVSIADCGRNEPNDNTSV
jgi:hypothetical protein